MTENNNRDFGPQDSMSWNTSSLAWVFAANTKAAIIRVQGIERPYIVRPRGKSGRSATAFAWVREAEL